MLHEAAKAGHWLCLKNLHLVVHWVPQLEKELGLPVSQLLALAARYNWTLALDLKGAGRPAFRGEMERPRAGHPVLRQIDEVFRSVLG